MLPEKLHPRVPRRCIRSRRRKYCILQYPPTGTELLLSYENLLGRWKLGTLARPSNLGTSSRLLPALLETCLYTQLTLTGAVPETNRVWAIRDEARIRIKWPSNGSKILTKQTQGLLNISWIYIFYMLGAPLMGCSLAEPSSLGPNAVTSRAKIS